MYAEVEQRRPQRDSNPSTLPTLAVYGLGYIGLPTAAMIAETGIRTVGIDLDPALVQLVNSGQVLHPDERGLSELIGNVVGKGTLSAGTTPVPADVHLIAVGTPVTKDNKPDLTALKAVARSIATVLSKGDLVIVESTVPPLTCEQVVAAIFSELTGLDHRSDYLLAHCPERVIPGDLLGEIVRNDRIVGGTTPEATEAAAWLYRRFVSGEIIETNARTAEFCKLMENSYRDVNIAFANEMSVLAATVDVDVRTAIELANRHPRVNIHEPGIGVGGHCIPVDPWFLVSINPDRSPLLRTARKVNGDLPRRAAIAIDRQLKELNESRVVLMGMSYKPNVDDLRESPAVAIAKYVAENPNLDVEIVEPYTSHLPHELMDTPNVKLVRLEDLDTSFGIAVLLTAHDLFTDVDNPFPNMIDVRDLLRDDAAGSLAVPNDQSPTPGPLAPAMSNSEVPAGQL